jgi:uncharacterized protein YjbI with pentapeptide repeats
VIDTMASGFINPYPGIDAFRDTPDDRAVFFGREEDRKALFGMVSSSPQAVLFSRSGLGKTSLVQAALMEDLRQAGYFPMIARVSADQVAGPVQSVLRAVERACESAGVRISGVKSTRSLWSFFLGAQFELGGKLRKPVLILDQFEELFTRVRLTQREDFKQQLADILRRRVPEIERRKAEHALAQYDETDSPEHETDKPDDELTPDERDARDERRRLVGLAFGEAVADVKVLLVMREDYLPELYGLVHQIPTILRHTLRLEPFSWNQAREAIEKPAETVRGKPGSELEFESGVVEEIVDFLRTGYMEGKAVVGNTIDPFQLQILCRRLNEKRWPRKTISSRDLGGKKGMDALVRQYYRDVYGKFPLVRPGWNARRLRPSVTNLIFVNFPRLAIRKLCESGLVAFGHRNTLGEKQIAWEYGVVSDYLETLVRQRLVRSEERLGSRFYEITHDSLLGSLLRERETRRKATTTFAVVLLAFILAPAYIVAVSGYKAWQLEIRARDLETVIANENSSVSDLNNALEQYRALDIDPVRIENNLAIPARRYRDTIFSTGAPAEKRTEAIKAYSELPLDLDLTDTQLIGNEPKLNFRELELSGRLIFHKAVLSRLSFAKTRLDTCYRSESDGPQRKNPEVACVSFSNATLNELEFTDSTLKGADFRGARISKSSFTGTSAAYADFTEAELLNITFSRSNMSDANLRSSRLRDATFIDTQLDRADFHNARLEASSFFGADLRRALFSDAELAKVRFLDSELQDADFSGAKTMDVSFSGSSWWLAKGWSPKQIAEFKERFPPQAYSKTRHYQLGIEVRRKELDVARTPEERAFAQNTLAWFRATRGADLNIASKEIEAALAIIPENEHLLDTMAFILMQQRDFARAAMLLKSALAIEERRKSLDDLTPEHLYRYALCLEWLGRHEEAKTYRERSEQRRYKPTYELVLVGEPPA